MEGSRSVLPASDPTTGATGTNVQAGLHQEATCRSGQHSAACPV